nr:cupin domain-containing protein [Amycolatopsis niigatensis]
MRVLLSPKTVGSTSGFLGVLDLAEGEFVTEHYHPYSEEFLYLVSGSVTVRLDRGEEVRVDAGEAILVPTGVRHRVRNVGGGPAALVFHLSPLAPRPELGHVDTEELLASTEPAPQVGG